MSKTLNIQKESARAVYLSLKDVYTIKEIALTIGISERTLYKWAEDGNWEELEKVKLNTKETQIAYLYDQLAKIRDANKDNIINNKTADVFSKITKNIKDLEDKTNLIACLAVLKEFLLYCASENPENLDLIKSNINDFISHKSKHTK